MTHAKGWLDKGRLGWQNLGEEPVAHRMSPALL